VSLKEELKGMRDLEADEILRRCVGAADRFANGAKQHDDMTMILIKVEEALAGRERVAV